MNESNIADTFEKAKFLSIKKWRTILRRLEVVEADTGEWCGFCLLAEHTMKLKKQGYRCTHCLIINKCNEYKDNNSTHLQPYIEFVHELIDYLNYLEEEMTDKNE